MRICSCLIAAWLPTHVAAQDLDPALRGSWPGYLRGGIRGVAVANGFAYCSLDTGGLLVVDVSNPAEPRIVGSAETNSGDTADGVAVGGDYAYVAAASGGVVIFDVANPAAPRRLSSWVRPGADVGRIVLSDKYAYLLSTHLGYEVDILDISKAENPQHLVTYKNQFTNESGFIGVAAAQRAVVDGRYAYLAGGGLVILNVSNPARPTVVHRFDLPSVYTAGLAVIGNYAYVSYALSQFWWGPPAPPPPPIVELKVIDIRDKANPRAVGTYSSLGGLPLLAVAGGFAFLGNASGGLEVLDIRNATSPRLVTTYRSDGGLSDLKVLGDYAYLANGALEIIDIRDPTNLARVARLENYGSALDVAVSGGYAYLLESPTGLRVLDVADPDKPTLVGGCASCGGEFLEINGDFAFVAGGDAILKVISLGDPLSPRVVGSLGTNASVSYLSVHGNRAYVSAGGLGLLAIDVSDPTKPIQLGRFAPGPGSWPGVTVTATSDRFAYVTYREWVQSAGHVDRTGVIDFSAPANPRRVADCAACLPVAGGVSPARGTVVGSYAFVAGVRQFYALDLTDPTTPRRLGSYDTGILNSTGVTVAGGFAHVGMFDTANAAGAVVVFDIGDAARPRRLGAYAASGSVRPPAVSQRFAYVPARAAGLVVVELSKPANPPRVGTYETNGRATGVAVAGSYAYVTETSGSRNSPGGLRVIDVRDRAKPRRVGSYDILEEPRGVALAGDHVFVIDRSGGFWIDVRDPTEPKFTGVLSAGYSAGASSQAVAFADGYVYIAAGPDGLLIVDVSQENNPKRLATFDTRGWASDVAVSDTHAFVADGSGGLAILDVRDPFQPRFVATYPVPGNAFYVTVERNLAFVGAGNAGLILLDIQSPANPRRLGAYTPVGSVAQVAIAGHYAHIATSLGLEVIDVSNPAHPRRVGGNTAFNVAALAVSTDKLFVAAGSEGLVVLDLFVPVSASELKLTSPARLNADEFAFFLNGKAGGSVRVQRSVDLQAWADWQQVTLPAGPLQLVDPSAKSQPMQFYRAVSP